MNRLTRTFNFATPFGGVLAALIFVAFVSLLVVAASSLGFRFDPFDRLAKRTVSAEATASAAVSEAAARGIEAAGERDTAARVDVVVRQIQAADHVAFSLTSDARIAIDAKDPLDPDRARRLRAVDQQLCDARPAICPDDSTTAHDAGDGDRTLHLGRPPAR
ncbi:hypothetical protein ACIGFJ_08140 [Brevundimonas diminuta]|uniref:hypothetical protein n=1 Tax=Brevundimonas diminuta TaxID=293 RepID=UPI0037CA2326